MFDHELALEILKQIRHSIKLINERFESINSANDFVSTSKGIEKLDSICMQLIFIGENLKNLDKITKMKLLVKYPDIEWKKIKGLRDIITHQYADINAEAIFDVCENKLDPLLKEINKIIQELS
ncbi:MAG: DUF86 domain-containing protein [Candidatus Delongbacteria bacterium]|nr:DUF86 domain-containing protein [Candidatus Delongbacteria bacterium]